MLKGSLLLAFSHIRRRAGPAARDVVHLLHAGPTFLAVDLGAELRRRNDTALRAATYLGATSVVLTWTNPRKD